MSSIKCLPSTYLKTAFSKSRLPHALLFLGGSSEANHDAVEWICTAMLCDRAGSAPCGDCTNCTRVSNLTHPNVRVVSSQLNAAGERNNEFGVDAIREIKRNQHLAHFEKGPQFWILHDTQLLTISAANALLKSLEEPAKDQYFLLFAPSTQTLMPTIISRCSRLYFPNIQTDKVSGPAQSNNTSDMFFTNEASRISYINGLSTDRTELKNMLNQHIQGLGRMLRSGEKKELRAAITHALEATLSAQNELTRNFNTSLTIEILFLKKWPYLTKIVPSLTAT